MNFKSTKYGQLRYLEVVKLSYLSAIDVGSIWVPAISIEIYLDHDKAQVGFSSVNSIPTFVGLQHLGMVPYRKIGVGSFSSY